MLSGIPETLDRYLEKYPCRALECLLDFGEGRLVPGATAGFSSSQTPWGALTHSYWSVSAMTPLTWGLKDKGSYSSGMSAQVSGDRSDRLVFTLSEKKKTKNKTECTECCIWCCLFCIQLIVL